MWVKQLVLAFILIFLEVQQEAVSETVPASIDGPITDIKERC